MDADYWQDFYLLPQIRLRCIMTVEEKDVDSYGRIVLPKSWRGRKVWVFDKGDELKVVPRPTSKLTDFFDEARIDVTEFSDYHKLKAEIEGRRLVTKR